MIGQGYELSGHLDPDGLVTLYWDADHDINIAALHDVLSQPKTPVWSTVTVGGSESFDGVWLRLTSTCRRRRRPGRRRRRAVHPAIPSRSPALVERDSLAYLAFRRVDGGAELGAIGHGPAGPQLARRLCDEIRAWGDTRTAEPVITAYPTDTRDNLLDADNVITKRWSRLVVPA
jgi:protein-L-isoaspartate(D-aspartate) O-methyltransferase